ncbi:MAG: lipase family protein, partial [Planctomycetota bacterium]
RRMVCGDDEDLRRGFRVYLAAHSMGGLICRCFLQNPDAGADEARRLVDKVFTYATPHNGIDLAVLGNVPGFFSVNNADNFNRARMAEYLGLGGEPERVNGLEGSFDAERFFCLVGTNDRDYQEASGLARRLVGPMSDGLVRIDNAVVRGAPRAFVPRSHSGDYGIVNSEEGYQNLVRFLFGDVRVDGVLKVESLTLPAKVQRALELGHRVRASYHFEAVLRCRGAAWDLHRRTVAEQSAVFRTFDEMFPRSGGPARDPYLFSTFLTTRARISSRRSSLGFSLDLGVLVPEYEIDNVLWLDDYHDGGYLFRDKLNFELTPPSSGGPWALRWGLDSRSPNRAARSVEATVDETNRTAVFSVPVRQRSRPGLEAALELRVRPWNTD